jgi:hypothetical protein
MPDTNLSRLEYLFSKSIGYEMDPLIQGTWQRNAIMTAMHSNPQHATILTKQEISDTLAAWGMNVRERYNAQAVPGNLIPLINQGVTFYNYRGEWCAEYDWGGTFGPWDVAYVNNTRKLGVWTILSCSSADIVYGYPTIAELMLRVGYENPTSPRGAVALIGSQGYTHANFNNPLDTGFYEAFTRQGASLLGEAFVASKAYLSTVTAPTDSQAATLREYTILGDPSLQVWTDVPAALAVSISPPAVPEGFTTNVSILAADSTTGTPVPDALVCLLRQDDVYVYGYTDENGSAALPVTPESSGSSGLSIGVTVTGYNRMPWFGTLETLTQRPAAPENVSAELHDGTWTIRWSPVLADERGLAADIDRYEIEMTTDGDSNEGGVDSLHVVSGTSATLLPAPRNASARVVAISRDGLRSRPSSGVGILRCEIHTGGGGR